MNPALERFTQFAGDMFMLVPPDAPAALFCGAMFSVGGQRFPAGAADIDPQRAKIRCLGEVAETIAQFVSPDDLAVLPAGLPRKSPASAALPVKRVRPQSGPHCSNSLSAML